MIAHGETRTNIKLTFFAQNTAKGKRAPNKFQGRPRCRKSLRPRGGVDGDLLSGAEYEKHLSEALPSADDERVLKIFKDKDRVFRMR